MHSSASPLTTLPLSPSVVGLLSQMSTFRPSLLATSTCFGFYFQCFSCIRLFVRKPRPQNFLQKNQPTVLPPKKKTKKRFFFSQTASSIWAGWMERWVFSVIRVWKCVLPVDIWPFTTSHGKLNEASGRDGRSCSSGVLLLSFVLLILDWNAVVVCALLSCVLTLSSPLFFLSPF